MACAMRACMSVRRDGAVCAKEPMGPWIAHAARVGWPHSGRRCQKWMGIGKAEGQTSHMRGSKGYRQTAVEICNRQKVCCRQEVQSLQVPSLLRGHRPRTAAHRPCSATSSVVFPGPSCPHRFARLHEDCTRSIPPLRRERRFALQSSLMDPVVAIKREPAHSRIGTSHALALHFSFATH